MSLNKCRGSDSETTASTFFLHGGLAWGHMGGCLQNREGRGSDSIGGLFVWLGPDSGGDAKVDTACRVDSNYHLSSFAFLAV